MEKEITITLTADESQVVGDYIFRKVMRLEDCDLKDSYCYPRLYNAYHKIRRAQDLAGIKAGIEITSEED